MSVRRTALAIAVLLAAFTVADAGEARVALVIGNNAYEDAPLRNARNDAEDLAKTLGELGFDVQKVLDADLKTMERAVNEFIRRLPEGGTALFYYSGHGLEIEGENFLVPIGFHAEDAVDAKYAAYSAERLLARMEAAPTKLNIVVLDACRNNPFRSVRSSTRGLAIMNAGDGSFIAYATAPHETASDNPGKRNGLFTEHLLKALAQPGLELEQVFKEARKGVYEASGQKQVPWTASSVIGEFVFREEKKFPYSAEDVELLDRAIARGGWTGKRRNEQGMLEVTHERTGLAFVLVPTGEFAMGSKSGGEDEKPVRTVTVPAFLLCRTECTQVAWDRVGGADERGSKGEDLPIEGMSWEEARRWCGKAGLRLPTEAEWEYACRAGTAGRWSFGDDAGRLGDHAWTAENSGERTHEVGGKRPNPWGLFDMHGNLWEFCEDDYGATYEGAPADAAPRRLEDATHRVLRGGSWANAAELSRSAARGYASPDLGDPKAGFRSACALPRGPDPKANVKVEVVLPNAERPVNGEPGELAIYFFMVDDREAFGVNKLRELHEAGLQAGEVVGGRAIGRWRFQPWKGGVVDLGPLGHEKYSKLFALVCIGTISLTPEAEFYSAWAEIPADSRLKLVVSRAGVVSFGPAAD